MRRGEGFGGGYRFVIFCRGLIGRGGEVRVRGWALISEGWGGGGCGLAEGIVGDMKSLIHACQC